MVLYNGMVFIFFWVVFYFVVFMIFGNYVFFNLLVVIFVEGF